MPMSLQIFIIVIQGILVYNKHVIEKHIMDLKTLLAISGPPNYKFASHQIADVMLSKFLANAVKIFLVHSKIMIRLAF